MSNILAPYSMTNDNAIMLLFVINMISISYVFLMNGNSIMERVKCIFYYESKSSPFSDRTHITRICNALLYIQSTLYATIITVSHMQKFGILKANNDAIIYIAAFALLFTCFLPLKRIIYDIVNHILFTPQQAQEWRSLYFFTIKLLGLMLAPAVIALLFIPSIPLIYVDIYLTILFILHIYTLFTGLKRIIFVQKCNYLDIFLYLCALEFLPTAVVLKSVLQLNEFITIKI